MFILYNYIYVEICSIKETYNMNILLALSIVSLAGIITAKIARKIRLPSVTGYLLAGLIIGPSILEIVPHHFIEELSYLSEIALGLIAFHIGESFEIKKIKRLAKNVISITLFQSIITVIVVYLVMYTVTKDLPFSILISAISAATAPAATIMVIKEYHSKGKLTDTLISVVALDDVVCILLFSISAAIVEVEMLGVLNFTTAIIHPLLKIICAVIMGGLLGIIIVKASNKQTSQDMILLIPICLIALGIGAAKQFGLSTLLTCVSIGAIVSNMSEIRHKIFDTVESFGVPIYLIFFTFSGMHLDLSVIKSLGLLSIIYIISRTVGKILGSYIGGVVTNAEPNVKKYLGLGLLPQAGVAIGLAVIAADIFPSMGSEIKNLIMAAVLFYEIIGPVLTKNILIKAHEASESC